MSMYVRDIYVPVRLRVMADNARDVDEFARVLRADLSRVANQKIRQKRHNVTVVGKSTVGDTYE